jgi:saccharopine dehydrogenase (NADP+, L-glutamate forming)
MPGYCKGWNVFVKLGLTDDSYKIETSDKMTYPELLEAFLPKGNASVKEKLIAFMGNEFDADILAKLEWLGIFEDIKIKVANASPAEILQNLLEEKWKLQEHDKDMIVMQHQFQFRTIGRELRTIYSSLVVKGEDQIHTAMAKTVGLPLAITAKLILQGKIKARGVTIPTIKEIYIPLLQELELLGIRFEEKEM